MNVSIELSLGKLMLCISVVTISACSLAAKGEQSSRPEETEVWKPIPPVVKAGNAFVDRPSDALVLFNGADLSHWQSKDGSFADWELHGDSVTVKAGAGDIVTQESFGSIQLYLEWKTPAVIKGSGQGRGNSGIFLQDRYELQILDSYNNATYVNGMAGSLYKQAAPLVNAAKKPGEWQSYNIIYHAPTFDDEALISPARVTVLWNGVLIHDNVELEGATVFIGPPEYNAHGDAPLRLQDHGDVVSYRNIWVRRLR